jgi:phage terminase large subunit
MHPRVWEAILRPALDDRSGWVLFIGSPFGANHFTQLYDQWTARQDSDTVTALYRASETGVLSA